MLLLQAVVACRPTQDPDKELKYTGPVMETTNVQTFYSDSARVKIKLKAPVQQQFETGDGIYPKGLDMIFLQENGQVGSTLKSSYGKYTKETDSYLVRGNVVVHNVLRNQTLNTEELRWDKQKQQIYTDKFVKIRTEDEILTGHGLRANQDFSKYRILKPAGIFSVKE